LPFHNVSNPKAGFNIKLSLDKIKQKDLFEYNLYIGMILNILFGTSSSFREEMMNQNLLNSLILERMIVDNYLIITFWIESHEPKKLISNIKYHFEHGEITKEEVERCKKVWISSEVIMTDNVEITVDNLINDIIEYNEIVPDKIPIVRKMTLEKLKKIRQSISFDNSSTVILVKEEK